MKKIAIITTRWNPEFVGPCVEWCVSTLQEKWIQESDIEVIQVPGGVEIPLLAKKLAEAGNYSAIVAVAFVCENPIYRFDFVASSVVENIIRVSVETGVPILSSCLSPMKFDRENPRDVEFYSKHMKIKWQEAGQSCLEIIKVHKNIS